MEPQLAYAAFASGFKSKLTYFISNIPDISDLLLLVEHKIRQKFIPAITSGQIYSDNERLVLSFSNTVRRIEYTILSWNSEIWLWRFQDYH